MEPYPSRRPLASRYANTSSTVSTPSPTAGLGGGGGGHSTFSPISSPRDTMASRLSSSSSSTGTSGTRSAVGLRDLPSPTLTSSTSPPTAAPSSASDMRSNLSELYHQMGELSNLSPASTTASNTASKTGAALRSNYGRSLSSAASGGRKYSTPGLNMMNRRDTTPGLGIVEYPTSPVDLDANGGPGLNNDMAAASSDSTALVTLPDLGEVEGQNGSLTSPNLVHSINPGMSLASATSFAKMQSSSSVRKESSSSMSTMRSVGQSGSMLDGQAAVVSSTSQSASSASSHSASASIGHAAVGHDGQALMMTGTKMSASSAKSHESTSSSMSARQITGANGESVMASSSSHRSTQSSSSQKSSCVTMTSAADSGVGSLTRSLLTSSQVI